MYVGSRPCRVILLALSVSACLFGADRRLTLKQPSYRVAAGEIIPLEFGDGDREFARTARELRADTRGDGPKVAIGKDELTGDVFLAAPLTILPGTYTVTVSAKQENGESRVGTAQVEVAGLKPVQISARRPVVLLNGFQIGLLSSCPASTSRGTFGDLEEQLYSDGVPRSIIFFDNCRECPDCYIEELGNTLGALLSRLQYTDGTPVQEVDVVAHSMGGLIVRSYLSGKRTAPGVFSPPSKTKIGKLVLIGTPNFGAGIASLTLGFGSQAPDMRLGSGFLWDLATWNQGTDDLRETDALAIVGAGGFSVGAKGASDGVVALTSASLAFSGAGPERTRVVPYCHTSSGWLDCHNTTPLANVSGPDHLTSRITRSFLSGTEDWRSIGTSALQDPYLSRYGGIALAFRDGSDRFYADIDQIDFATHEGTSYLQRGPGVVFYTEWLPQQQHEFHIALRGNDIPVRYNASAGGFKPLSVKMRPLIYRVQPAAGLPVSRTLSLAPGSLISIFGDGFSSVAASAASLPLPVELANVSAYVNGAPLGLLYAGPHQVNAYLPQGISGLTTLTVRTSTGQHSTNVMIAPAVPAIFTQNGAGTGVVAAVNAVTGVPVTEAAPVNRGDFVSLFVTGLGATARSGQLDQCVEPPTVSVGSTYAKVLFAGLAPGYIGLYQINIQLPNDVQSGSAVPIAVKAGKYWSNVATIPLR